MKIKFTDLEIGTIVTGESRACVKFKYLVGNEEREGWLGWLIEPGNSSWINEDSRVDMRRQANVFVRMKNGEFK